ncbi:MAG TPA: D-sedoheptulose 7-phosphate isomerase [Pyrinomonadaceae bacterium]|nr:D-sedoheptulose 7-phosphate isomerase [Pyrinomonadaceae bacterium]
MMEKVVFTNGCFDILHPGHIDLLQRARSLGTKLIVAINSDESVREIKGAPRPFLSQEARASILRALRCVDEVKIFDEPTPAKIIEEIKPDVLVKGGDWRIEQIIGADYVLKRGGEVYSLSLKDGFSSSAIVEKIQNDSNGGKEIPNSLNDSVSNSLDEHIEVFRKLSETETRQIEKCADIIFEAVAAGKKVLICGNGGSAADAQHIAAEFVGRYETERRALAAIALTTDTSALTAISNDYGFERVFSRQVEALASPGDVLISLSTSGNSPNVIAAVMKAREKGCRTVGLTGSEGKKLASLCDACILVPSRRTARVQEVHITIAHIWCEIIDSKFMKGEF